MITDKIKIELRNNIIYFEYKDNENLIWWTENREEIESMTLCQINKMASDYINNNKEEE